MKIVTRSDKDHVLAGRIVLPGDELNELTAALDVLVPLEPPDVEGVPEPDPDALPDPEPDAAPAVVPPMEDAVEADAVEADAVEADAVEEAPPEALREDDPLPALVELPDALPDALPDVALPLDALLATPLDATLLITAPVLEPAPAVELAAVELARVVDAAVEVEAGAVLEAAAGEDA